MEVTVPPGLRTCRSTDSLRSGAEEGTARRRSSDRNNEVGPTGLSRRSAAVGATSDAPGYRAYSGHSRRGRRDLFVVECSDPLAARGARRGRAELPTPRRLAVDE